MVVKGGGVMCEEGVEHKDLWLDYLCSADLSYM